MLQTVQEYKNLQKVKYIQGIFVVECGDSNEISLLQL